ncbi:hypothetical protein GHNINEIG_00200 [Hydrogenovibrio crunogenus]|uniref:PRTase-CE domain-containing protein n=1 Tax=Hydrogenovibrio crunogenus TaxID=39765 RepID=A0A4P7NX38_9GAMM|nr:hypothetical protein [Hydrogenovibrio crunogenus]QBZ82176.1 hypothetical protein GHNINEIG_00200 [Hydrogenovibrio crunogenus]
MTFHIPDEGHHFFDQTVGKVNTLISKKVWAEIEMLSFSAWLRNFKTDEEKYFAAHLLDALIFRSNKMIHSSYFDIFNQRIPKALRDSGLQNLIRDYSNNLRRNIEFPLKFVTVEKSSPGASGDLFIRSFRRHLRIKQHHVISLDTAVQQADTIDVLVFIDDITGTGRQFSKCLNKVYANSDRSLYEIFRHKLIIYCPLIGHTKAINKIDANFPSVQTLPVEILSDEHGFFYSTNGKFRDGVNSIDDAKNFYKDIFYRRGLNPGYTFGYKKQALTCFFSNFSSPNNSLPIFYHDEDLDKWNPLFGR